MLLSDQMPDLRRYERAGEKVDALGEYIYSLRQQLNYVLSNIEEENLSEELRTMLRGIEQTAQKAEKQLSAKAAKVAAWPVNTVCLIANDEQDPAQALGGKWTKLDTAPMEGVTAWKRTE